MTEALLALSMVIIGTVLLVVFLTFAVFYSTPTELYISGWLFAVQIVAAIALMAIGLYRVAVTIWKVGASDERRSAIVSRAGEIELFNEIRRHREDTPTVPLEKYRPVRGERLPFRLVPSRRTIWDFGSSALMTFLFVPLATILILTSWTAFERGETNWLATVLAVPISLAAAWSVYSLFRKLLVLTGIGTPELEVSRFPFVAGEAYNFYLTQPGRMRLKLVDVILKCQEEATFNEGTDIRTEKRIVYEQRLYRRRGVEAKPAEPFVSEFEMRLPASAMHSFKSTNNRITWKIVVRGQVAGWPRHDRNFVISVLPQHKKVVSP